MVDKRKHGMRKLDGILPEEVDRRSFLEASVATIGMGWLAGCTGDSGTEGGAQSDGATTETPPTGGTTQESSGGQDSLQVDGATFRGPWKAEPSYSTHLVASRNGFWEDSGLRPPEASRGFGSGDTAKRVGSGKTSAGFTGITPQISGAASGWDITTIGMNIASSQLVLVYRQDQINSAADIEEKDILLQDALGRQAWPIYVDAVGANSDRVNGEFVKEATGPALLNKGEYDGVFTFSNDIRVYQDNVENYELGFAPVYAETKIAGFPLIVNSNFLRENREYVVRMLTGFSAAGHWALLNPGETVAMMQEINSGLQTVETDVLETRIKSGFVATNLTSGVQENGFGYLDMDVLKQSYEKIGPLLDIDEVPSAEEFADPTIQEDADLSTFTSDEWNQITEWAQPFSDLWSE